MAQSRKMSLAESMVNVAVGYGVAVVAQLMIFPFFEIHIPISDNLLIGLFFTIVSLIRSYVLRRIFNAIKERA